MTEDKIEELATAAYAVYVKEQHQDERPALQRELNAVEKQLQNAVTAVLNGFASEALKTSMVELEERRDKLREAIQDSAVPMPKLALEHFTYILSRIIKNRNIDLLNTIVNRIILTEEDTVIICINLTNENNLPPLEKVLFSVSQGEGRRFKSSHLKFNEKTVYSRKLLYTVDFLYSGSGYKCRFYP